MRYLMKVRERLKQKKRHCFYYETPVYLTKMASILSHINTWEWL